MVGMLVGACLAFSPALMPRCDKVPIARCRIAAFSSPPLQQQAGTRKRCRSIVAFEDDVAPLSDKQIEAIFQQFDVSGDGLIDLGELQEALSKAGKPVTREAAEEILKSVDTNNDGQISLTEFKAVFQLAPGAVPEGLKPLTGAGGFFLEGLSRVGDALGIEVRGQWRTTMYGSRYVDDVIGNGELVEPGDIAKIHYTVTLLSNDQVVETSRSGPPRGFQVGTPSGDSQDWDDAIAGMRVGGQRRVYTTGDDNAPTARYDIEIVSVEEGSEKTLQEGLITSLGGRRAAFRLLFAASFVPYFLPEDIKPAFFKDDFGRSKAPPPMEESGELTAAASGKPKVDKSDEYVSRQLDLLFANEIRPATGSLPN